MISDERKIDLALVCICVTIFIALMAMLVFLKLESILLFSIIVGGHFVFVIALLFLIGRFFD